MYELGMHPQRDMDFDIELKLFCDGDSKLVAKTHCLPFTPSAALCKAVVEQRNLGASIHTGGGAIGYYTLLHPHSDESSYKLFMKQLRKATPTEFSNDTAFFWIDGPVNLPDEACDGIRSDLWKEFVWSLQNIEESDELNSLKNLRYIIWIKRVHHTHQAETNQRLVALVTHGNRHFALLSMRIEDFFEI